MFDIYTMAMINFTLVIKFHLCSKQITNLKKWNLYTENVKFCIKKGPFIGKIVAMPLLSILYIVNGRKFCTPKM